MKTHMQNILSVAVIVFFISCNSSDDAVSVEVEGFKDQNLQGSIDGISWQAASGRAKTNSFSGDKYWINIIDKTLADPCSEFNFEGDRVFFSVPMEVGLYPIEISSNADDRQTVTLFKSSESLNIIATVGAVEVLTLTDDFMTGRIDAVGGLGSFVNGNFSVPICK
jgi:hypothetical protein